MALAPDGSAAVFVYLRVPEPEQFEPHTKRRGRRQPDEDVSSIRRDMR